MKSKKTSKRRKGVFGATRPNVSHAVSLNSSYGSFSAQARNEEKRRSIGSFKIGDKFNNTERG